MKRRARVPPPVAPTGAIATYRKLLRAIERDFDDGVRVLFERETGVRFDAPADGGDGPTLDVDVVARLKRELVKLVKSATRRKDLVKVLADVAKRTDATAAENLARQLRSMPGIDVIPPAPELGRIIELFREEQTDLIRSVTYEKMLRIRKVLDANRGARVENVAKRIREETSVSRSKAELIARDQVAKLNAAVTWSRHTAAGITEYTWSTSGDERVRPGHARLDGQRFKYAKPPVVDESGRRANPGEDYQCRCLAVPVLSVD